MRSPKPHSSGMIGILSIMLLFSSCYSYRVATAALPSTGYSKANTISTYSLFWGIVNKPQMIQTPICDSMHVNGVAEVKVKTNFGNALLTVVTLGIYCPLRIEWRCSTPCPPPAEPI
jgi:hypothetical protein